MPAVFCLLAVAREYGSGVALMPIGPGKYDDICTEIRQRVNAQGVVLIIFGGNLGHGFSAQLDIYDTLKIPDLLRSVAQQIEDSFASDISSRKHG